MSQTIDDEDDTLRATKNSRMDERSAHRLAAELSELFKQQAEALQTAIYLTMSSEEAAEYDKRRQRITELCILLGKYHVG